MHKASMLRMEWFIKNYLTLKTELSALDVGSLNINGSYKRLFNKHKYTGLDICAGKNVDLVIKNPYVWDEIATEEYDVVVSGQAFEHIEFFWITFSEMIRVLKHCGLICIIVPSEIKEHRYPVDCYRFLSDGVVALARYFCLELLHTHTNCSPTTSGYEWEGNLDTMLIAKKPYVGKAKCVDLSLYKCEPIVKQKYLNGLRSYERVL